MKTLLSTLLILLPLAATAQQGTVRYEETVKLDIQIPPEMQHMRSRFPSQNVTSRQLLFDGATSLLTNLPEPEQEAHIEAETPGMRFRMITNRGDEVTYIDGEEGKLVEQRDFMGRTFLISGELPPVKWRLTDEWSEFLGRTCRKAVATVRDTVAVEAWFTPEIPVPVGPGRYAGLPGLIMVLSEDAGQRTFVAKEVTLGPLAAGALQPPKKGQKLTRAKFDAIVEEKLKEMGVQGRPGGSVQFRINQ